MMQVANEDKRTEKMTKSMQKDPQTWRCPLATACAKQNETDSFLKMRLCACVCGWEGGGGWGKGGGEGGSRDG